MAETSTIVAASLTVVPLARSECRESWPSLSHENVGNANAFGFFLFLAEPVMVFLSGLKFLETSSHTSASVSCVVRSE